MDAKSPKYYSPDVLMLLFEIHIHYSVLRVPFSYWWGNQIRNLVWPYKGNFELKQGRDLLSPIFSWKFTQNNFSTLCLDFESELELIGKTTQQKEYTIQKCLKVMYEDIQNVTRISMDPCMEEHSLRWEEEVEKTLRFSAEKVPSAQKETIIGIFGTNFT